MAQRALRRRIPGAGEQEPRLAVLAKLADFYDLSLDALVGRQRSVRVTALLENTAGREGLCAAHGLSLYIETPRYKILFDMGPGDEFLSRRWTWRSSPTATMTTAAVLRPSAV